MVSISAGNDGATPILSSSSSASKHVANIFMFNDAAHFRVEIHSQDILAAPAYVASSDIATFLAICLLISCSSLPLSLSFLCIDPHKRAPSPTLPTLRHNLVLSNMTHLPSITTSQPAQADPQCGSPKVQQISVSTDTVDTLSPSTTSIPGVRTSSADELFIAQVAYIWMSFCQGLAQFPELMHDSAVMHRLATSDSPITDLTPDSQNERQLQNFLKTIGKIDTDTLEIVTQPLEVWKVGTPKPTNPDLTQAQIEANRQRELAAATAALEVERRQRAAALGTNLNAFDRAAGAQGGTPNNPNNPNNRNNNGAGGNPNRNRPPPPPPAR